MPIVLTILRALLIATFVVAGFSKLSGRASFSRALDGLGIPRRLTTPLAAVIPVAELACGVLIASAWVGYGVVAALALLLVFSIVLGINLAVGRAPGCDCFGPVLLLGKGWSALGRNAILAAAAALLLWQEPLNLAADGSAIWPLPSSGEFVALVLGAVALILICGEGFLLLQLLQQQGRILLRLAVLERRTGPPDRQLVDLNGQSVSLDDLVVHRKRLLLVFVTPVCGSCRSVLQDVSRWQSLAARDLIIAVVGDGSLHANRSAAAEFGVQRMFVQRGQDVSHAFAIHATPAAVLIGPDGMLAARVAVGVDAVRDLYARAVEELVL